MGILITRFNSRTVMGKQFHDNINDIAQKINTKLFDTTIRESIAIREAQAKQKTFFLMLVILQQVEIIRNWLMKY